MARKSVLITGCSDGSLGYAMAKIFSEQGFLVFATVRDVAKAGSLTQDKNIEVVILDVTSKESITSCANTVDQRTGGTLDILVNNAALSTWFPLLDVDVDEARRAFETNLWSMLIITQTFIPMLVRAKGTVCNHGSIAGCFPMLWDGIYGSSKAAAKHMSEVMRYELEPLGVRVLCALIGIVDTPMWDKQKPLNLPANSHYRPIQGIIDQVRSAEKGAKPTGRDSATPEATGRAIIRHILQGRSGFVWVGGMARRLKFLINWLPPSVVFKVMNKTRGLEALRNANLVEST